MTIRLSVDPIRGQHSAMWRTREYLLGLLLAIVLLITGTQTAVANDTNLVTLYVDGVARTVSSKDQTVGQFLEHAGISVGQKDLVEPNLDTSINEDGFKVNVYRARPVLVVDGDRREVVVSPLNSPRLIAESAGIKVYPEDDFILERIDNILQDGIIGQRLTIKRAAVVNIDVYGEMKVFRTQKATVEDLLREKDITIQPEDHLSISTDTPVTTGMTFALQRLGRQLLTVDEPIPFDQEIIQDFNMDIGSSRVEVAGVDGVKTVTYELNMVNGREVSRAKIQEVVVTPAKKARVVKGAKIEGPSGNVAAFKADVMQAAGISPADYGYVDYIISHESGWCALKWQGQVGYCPSTYAEKYPGSETATTVGYGLCQSTPAIKMATAGADWRTNAVTQLLWCNGYALGRYGSWANAYATWLRQHWW